MSGILEIFLNDEYNHVQNAHSRKTAGVKDPNVEFTRYTTVGAAQELYDKITAPLPYRGGAVGPINDTL